MKQRHFYSILRDEETGCSSIEQLSFNIQTVDENHDTHEDFLQFHEVHNIKSNTIVAAIKDIILIFNLSFEFCFGQIYDGTSNMVGKKWCCFSNISNSTKGSSHPINLGIH